MTDPQEPDSAPSRAALGRGLLVLFAAVVIAILILNSLGDSDAKKTTAAPAKATTTTAPAVTTSTTAALRSPTSIKVIAINATDTSGVAQTATDSLQKSRYDTLKPISATTKRQVTNVYYQPGYEQEAKVLATALNLPSSSVAPLPTQASQLPVAVTDLQSANIVVVIGADQATSFAPKTTSSTARATTSTTG